jgi:aquaporin Z
VSTLVKNERPRAVAKKRTMSEPPRQLSADEIDLREFEDSSREWRRRFSEAWGTFLLVLAAAGAVMVAGQSGGKVTPGMAAAAPGLTVMVVIYFMGAVGGAHLNPAVTYAFALRGNFPWGRVPGYIGAQLVGALAAVLFLDALLGNVQEMGATRPEGLSELQAMALEVVLTAGLVNTILGTASGARNIGANGAIAVGAYIAVAGLWSAPLTGASMNPARSLAPDVLRGELATTYIYVLGPFIGASLGVVFQWLLKGPPTREGAITAQGDPKDSGGR